MNSLALQSLRMKRSSSCLKCQLIGHQVAPSQRHASISSSTVGELRIISATVSAAVIDAAKCYIDTAQLMLIGRMQSPGGYTRTRDAFSMRQLDFGEWLSTRSNATAPNEP